MVAHILAHPLDGTVPGNVVNNDNFIRALDLLEGGDHVVERARDVIFLIVRTDDDGDIDFVAWRAAGAVHGSNDLKRR
jgi:hypothetical protein